MLLAQCSAQLVSNAMAGSRGDKNTQSGRSGALKFQAFNLTAALSGILCSYSWLLFPIHFSHQLCQNISTMASKIYLLF